ncbi:aromatic acid exporter family protein [Peribacillus saganii]|uniref:Aromatic acid exporter family protein n=1 Tax=Peribacillus saganii TaxID=2303992 RepID=A0A372LM45_9BACI|nr:aromatic acid exporter family protein [Peribacillus saganii]RFU68164.1 aromatic acid exporter family protein [Peribacillus saganii]
MKLGARILKTGIAIVLSLYLADLFSFPSPVFAGIAAIFAIQPTIYRSYLSIIEQLQANLIGAIIAVFFVILFGNDIFIIGLAVVIAITINLKLKLEKTIILSIVTVIAIMESQQGDFMEFALIRFLTIMLGILSSFIVNLVFLPPKYETKLYHLISDVTEQTLKWIRISSRHATEHTLLKKDISRIKGGLSKLEQTYSMYKEEREYFKKASLAKSRKLVIYRQMITVTTQSVEILRKLHRFENELHQMPERFQMEVQTQLDRLLFYHEQSLLHFIGKVKAVEGQMEKEDHTANRKELLALFFAQQRECDMDNEHLLYHMMPLVSSIIEYGEQLDHLTTLINSFKSYHVSENEVHVQQVEDEY